MYLRSLLSLLGQTFAHNMMLLCNFISSRFGAFVHSHTFPSLKSTATLVKKEKKKHIKKIIPELTGSAAPLGQA